MAYNVVLARALTLDGWLKLGVVVDDYVKRGNTSARSTTDVPC